MEGAHLGHGESWQRRVCHAPSTLYLPGVHSNRPFLYLPRLQNDASLRITLGVSAGGTGDVATRREGCGVCRVSGAGPIRSCGAASF